MSKKPLYVWATVAELAAYKNCFILAMKTLEEASRAAGPAFEGLPIEALEYRLKQLRGDALTIAPAEADPEVQAAANQSFRDTQQALMDWILAAAKRQAKSD